MTGKDQVYDAFVDHLNFIDQTYQEGDDYPIAKVSYVGQ